MLCRGAEAGEDHWEALEEGADQPLEAGGPETFLGVKEGAFANAAGRWPGVDEGDGVAADAAAGEAARCEFLK